MKLVLDWDGTVTTVDTLGLVVGRFGDPALAARAEAEFGRPLTVREWIELEFPTVRAELGEAVSWLLERVRVRPGFREIVAEHSPLVVSSGFHELIEPVLEREGIEVELVANRVDARPDGWQPRFRPGTECDVCGGPCKAALLPPGEVAYAGDAHSDFCPAAVATRVFVCGDVLARHLDKRGIPYKPFRDFFDLSRALSGR